MSDVSLYQRNDAHQLVKQAKQSHDRGGAPNLATRSLQRESQLASLPFDVLLCIADSLRVQDINTLELVREPRFTPPFLLLINAFSLDMPASEGLCEVVLAESPTCVCYAEELPAAACERVSSHKRAFAQVLANVVKRGDRLQNGWHERRPELTLPYRDDPSAERGVDRLAVPDHVQYTLCCTRTGKVICWDVLNSECVAEWQFGRRLGDLKCRVEFDERTVYFALAKKNRRSVRRFNASCP